MRYFKITFQYHSRPLFRKGRLKQCSVTFAASNITDAYRLALDDGAARFPRHTWQVLSCEELPAPPSQRLRDLASTNNAPV